uniref:Uncharacterized protein n=1 Tax=Mustela putorius furo TaxID=9669 RepID=M3YB86_MUSPF
MVTRARRAEAGPSPQDTGRSAEKNAGPSAVPPEQQDRSVLGDPPARLWVSRPRPSAVAEGPSSGLRGAAGLHTRWALLKWDFPARNIETTDSCGLEPLMTSTLGGDTARQRKI